MTAEEKPRLLDLPPAYNKQSVVERLEKLLADAREGKISRIVFVYEHEGSVCWGGANYDGVSALGLTSRLLHNLNREWDRG